MSIPVDDRRIRKRFPIDCRFEDQGLRASLLDSVVELTVDDQNHRFAAVGAGGSDFDLEETLPQVPLHEGRRYRVLSSSGVETFSGAEDEMVRRLIDGDREGPRDLRTVSANEEEEIRFEILHDLRGARSSKSQRL